MNATVLWHPAHKPVPRGWIKVADAPGHHARYSVLIEKSTKGKTRHEREKTRAGQRESRPLDRA